MKCLMPCKDSILIGFLFLLVFFFVRGGSDSDSDIWALSELKRGVSDPAGVLSTWDLGRSRHCSWLGVSCGSDSRVVGVRLAGAERGDRPGSLSCSASGRFRRGGSGSLRGQISPLVGGLRQLRVLSLPYNDLVGEVPVEIWGLENLRVLDLEGNSLTGKLPVSFGGLRNLRVLNLGFNRFSGEIPVGLSQCRDLKVLNLAGNEVTGNIPGSLGRLSNLRGLCLSRNRLAGEIPGSLGECRQLRRLLLFSNRLSGVVPREFGQLRKLEVLDVSENGLSGPIPAELGRCVRMSVLGLSSGDSSGRLVSIGENRFEESIPVEIAALPSLKIVWAPRGDATMNPRRDRVLTSVETQSENQQDLSLNSQNDTADQSGNGGLNSIEVASVASASAIVAVLFALIVLFFYTRKWMPDSRVQGLEPREITEFSHIGAPMTYEGIVRATGNFNASNCIGNGGFGSTFRSEIQPGIIVAVKRLSVGRFQQGIQQFHAEVKTLGRVRHPNLVTLLGYHASETEMFLIYNYLPGGNLEKFIKERSERATDWKVLHKIALDIAHALEYLHDRCVPRVLHRDVKPSNILLDNDLNAYLSDFGLSRLLGTSETHATTGVAGTFGYLAPEYAMTCRVSDKSDVYSYGVVLLELISDKRPLDPSFSSHGDGFNIVTWACLLLKQGRAKEVFTAGLWDDGPHDDLVEMLHLAVTCTNETLSIRPTMKHVVQRLKRIKPVSLSSP